MISVGFRSEMSQSADLSDSDLWSPRFLENTPPTDDRQMHKHLGTVSDESWAAEWDTTAKWRATKVRGFMSRFIGTAKYVHLPNFLG